MKATSDSPNTTGTFGRPPFDAELVPQIEAAAAMPRFSDESLPTWRQVTADGMPGVSPTDLTAGGTIDVEERDIPGADGDPDIRVLILRPRNAAGPVAGIYHTHGGGMVIGHRRSRLELFTPYVTEGKAVVVSVEYRLAPEHPDPAPINDCYAGLVWMADNADELGIDLRRLIVTGDSAGGGLAAGTALLARDRGYPQLSHQVLSCPMLDDRMQTHSSQMLDGEGIWDRNDNTYGWTSLLGDRRGTDEVPIYAAPGRATDLSNLPRTYLDCGSAEVFRDEILDFAARLSQAGVSVDLHMWGGGVHGFDGFVPHAAVSQACLAARDAFFRRAIEL